MPKDRFEVSPAGVYIIDTHAERPSARLIKDYDGRPVASMQNDELIQAVEKLNRAFEGGE